MIRTVSIHALNANFHVLQIMSKTRVEGRGLAHDLSLDLRSIRSGLFFVLITFVAAITGSSGSFVWTHTNATYVGDDFSIWQGWWMGGFLQAILINGPILYVFTRPMSAWKKLML